MKSKDQELLEEAYNEVMLNELNWKGALAAGAMATSGLLGGGTAMAASEPSNDFVSSRIETITKHAPNEEGSSYIGGVEVFRYLALANKLTPKEKQLIQAASKLSNKHGIQKMNELIANKHKAFGG